MDRLVVTSMRQSGGKTTAIIGLGKALNKRIAYIKPFGERLLYRKKRLWDYDAALMTRIFELEENPEDMSIGFHHSKLLYMFDEKTAEERLKELLSSAGKDKDIVFVEAGKDITYGVSVGLDALSMAMYLDAPLLVLASGDDDTILDDIAFLGRHIRMEKIRLLGVIINKVLNVADFTDVHLPKIRETGIDVLGVIPYQKELTSFSAGFLADRLFAKVIAGEANLNRPIKSVFIGAMSAMAALKSPYFREENKAVITSGDRADMIVAALESDTAAVVLTNNILPSPNLIAQAARNEVPMLLVALDTYQAAKQIDGIEALPTKDETEKIAFITSMIKDHVNLNKFS